MRVGRGPWTTQLWQQLAAQQEHIFGWAPVFFGLGIAAYFSADVEPHLHWALVALIIGLISLFCSRYCSQNVRIASLILAATACGFGVAGTRAHLVAEPVLGFRYYGPIEGRIILIDRSQSEAVRLTLDRVVLSRMEPARTPAHVRLSLHGEQGHFVPEPGQIVMTTGHLSPPSGPVEPGGFDFQRMAWFQGLGAVGYTRNPLVLAVPSTASSDLWVYRQRVAISQGVLARLPGETGAFAAAIMTGDRSAMGQESLRALRGSNLAHLLAISGMHMGILAAFVFGLLRYGLALWPRAALYWPTKKIAAMFALTVAAVYLALSGGSIATQRAFIMVAVMLGAVMLDKRALTLRAVGVAALVVLILRPEALFGPGFQMSFAATTALVAVFGAIRGWEVTWMPTWTKPIGAVFVSSFVAGLATAPFAAYHFNQIAQFGLIANLLTVPLMGTLVMPAAVLAAVLAPFGLEMVGLWLMDLGLTWILSVAHFVSAQEGALRHVVTPGSEVLALIALGGLFGVLWRGSLRALGLGPLFLGFALWSTAERPALLVADSGSLIGVMSEAGRVVSKERGESYAATSWFENDGAPVSQEEAYAREGLQEEGRAVRAVVAQTRILNIRGATALAALRGCGGADLLITNQEMEPLPECDVYDIRRLRQTGALAGWLDNGKLRLVSVRDHTGARLWNTPSIRQRATLFDQLAVSQ